MASKLRRKTTVVVEYTPVRLIEKLEATLREIMDDDEGNDYGEIFIEVARGDVKRFKCTRSFLVSAL